MTAKTINEEIEEALQRVNRARAAAAAIKYRDPVSGNTWCGRGSAPVWVREAEARGISRRAFLVESHKLNATGGQQTRYFPCEQCCPSSHCDPRCRATRANARVHLILKDGQIS